MFQSRHRMIHGVLHILRQRTGHPSYIHFVCIASFRFNKDLVTIFICKPHHFIFNRRTISWSGPFDGTAVERRSVQIFTYNFVCLLICISQPAGNLINLYCFWIRRKGKRNNLLISFLFLHFFKIHSPSIDSGRCSRLKPIHLNSQFFQRIRQMIRCLKSVRSGKIAYISINTSGFQIRTCTENHRLRMIDRTGIQANSRHLSFLCKNLCHFRLNNLKSFCILQHHAHGTAVLCLVCLRSERMYCRPLGYIQHFRLDKCPVDDFAHLSSQSV